MERGRASRIKKRKGPWEKIREMQQEESRSRRRRGKIEKDEEVEEQRGSRRQERKREG